MFNFQVVRFPVPERAVILCACETLAQASQIARCLAANLWQGCKVAVYRDGEVKERCSFKF